MNCMYSSRSRSSGSRRSIEHSHDIRVVELRERVGLGERRDRPRP